MEDVMKAYTAITLGLTLAASAALGQASVSRAADARPYLSNTLNYNGIRLPQAKKNMLWTLSSENDGVVESVIGQIAHMRIMLPQEDMQDLEAVLTQLANYGRTPVIRYKAYLATLVFVNPGMFTKEAAHDYTSSDEFLGAIASRLQQTLLGLNAQ
jgi:hypothetical protein